MKVYELFKSTVLLFFLIACASCNTLAPDTALAASKAGDYTALIEGCGNQLISGYTYCRMSEGQSTNQKLWVVGPRSNCERDACVFYTFLDNKGKEVHGGSIPKNKNRKSVKWSKLVSRETFQVAENGFWGLVYEVFWLDEDKNERRSTSQGEIRLRVHLKEKDGKHYKPLANIEDDPNFVWEYHDGGVVVKMTTGMRTYVSKKK